MATDYQATTIASGVAQQTTMNAEWAAIELALSRVLNVYGDSTVGTNAMQVDIDMNSNTIINLSAPANANDAARLIDVQAATTTGLPDQTGNDGKFLVTDGSVVTWSSDVGDPGFEAAGIDIGGVTYTTGLRVNDIGGANAAQFVIHRHSTTLQPLLIGARTNDDTASHTAVTAGQSLFTIFGAGWTDGHYDLFGSLDIQASSLGSISATSSPGKYVVSLSPDGSNTPEAVLTLDADKSAQLEGIMKMQEVAAAIADTAGYGQLWVKNTTPCELWFTDDAGTDTLIV